MASTLKKSVLKKGAQSRAKVIAAAANLLQRRGYNGTGLSQIVKESGSPKGSLYFHFPGGKEELTIAALKESGGDFGERLRESITPATQPGAAIEIACKVLADELLESNFEKGCPLATVTLEAATHSEPIREICAEHFQAWEELIESMLQSRQMPEAQARDLATTALASIEGAMLLCRAYKSTEPLEKVGRQLKRILELVAPLE